jgi:hypothetical protein
MKLITGGPENRAQKNNIKMSSKAFQKDQYRLKRPEASGRVRSPRRVKGSNV